jgi:hypothetical protein
LRGKEQSSDEKPTMKRRPPAKRLGQTPASWLCEFDAHRAAGWLCGPAQEKKIPNSRLANFYKFGKCYQCFLINLNNFLKFPGKYTDLRQLSGISRNYSDKILTNSEKISAKNYPGGDAFKVNLKS